MPSDNLLTKVMQTTSLQRQRSKKDGLGTGVEMSENKNKCTRTTPDGCPEESWWTKCHHLRKCIWVLTGN